MKTPAHKPGFGEQLLKKGAPIVAFASAAMLFNTIQNHTIAYNKAELDRCQKYTFETQRNECIAAAGDRNILALYGAIGAEAIALGGTIITAASAIKGLSWNPNRGRK